MAGQCKDPQTQAALPEQDMPHQQGGVSTQAGAPAQQARLGVSGVPDQALLLEPTQQDQPCGAPASGTNRESEEAALL